MIHNEDNIRQYLTEITNRTTRIYRAQEQTTDTRQCHRNLTNRIPAISNSTSFHDCANEWIDVTDWSSRFEHQSTEELCLCGMKICNVFFIVNKHTKVKAQLGSECIKRINPKLMEQYEKEQKEKKKRQKEDEKTSKDIQTKLSKSKIKLDKMFDKRIKLYNEDERERKRIEKERKELEEKLKKFRGCNECHELIIPITEPTYKTMCKMCYINDMKKTKKCEVCNAFSNGLPKCKRCYFKIK